VGVPSQFANRQIVDTPYSIERRADSVAPYLPGSLVPLDLLMRTPEEVEEYGRDRFSIVSSALRHGRWPLRAEWTACAISYAVYAPIL
jgi:hypothetical protein